MLVAASIAFLVGELNAQKSRLWMT